MPTFHFHLEVITPVFIGMDRNKDYTAGLDFIYDKDSREYQVYTFNRLLSQVRHQELVNISNYLIDRNFDQVAGYFKSQKWINSNTVLYSWPSSFGNAEEIRRHIQDGLGNWIIPGSSLKGSIRSILATYLYKQQPQGMINLDKLFGNIENNLMRFIHVTDCKMCTKTGAAPVGIYPVKIFSADLPDKGMWKDGRQNRHNEEFDPSSFVTHYEMLKDNMRDDVSAEGDFLIRWGWDNEAKSFFEERIKHNVKNANQILDNLDPHWLIQRIKDHTDQFLGKEIYFFESFHNPSLTDDFFDELTWLKEENKKDPNSCLLRVGGNVGWHSITGDWQWNDFVQARAHNKNNRNQHKTRKIVFDEILSEDENEIMRFTLPGFVKLTLL